MANLPTFTPGTMIKASEMNQAFAQIFNMMYPVGSIYMSATLSTAEEVESALGGTWVAWGAGRVPVGVNSGDTDFGTVESTGGEKTHVLTTSELPAHTHGSKSLTGYVQNVLMDDGASMLNNGIMSFSDGSRERSWSGSGGNAMKRLSVDATHEHTSVGSGKAHNNLQPYITCYMYKRTA